MDYDDDDNIEDGPRRCPNCERPNQFGELCESCREELEHETRLGDDELDDCSTLDDAPWRGEF